MAQPAEPTPRGPLVPAPFRVAHRERDTADTWTLTLEPVSGPAPVIRAGQFMMVYAFGVGEVPVSVSGPPNSPGPVILTVRAVGAVTRAICAVAPGGVLGLRGPYGSSWPVDDAAGGDVVVVAGGIGLAPLRPAILGLLGARERYGRLVLLYGGRSPEQLLYGPELEAWRERGIEVQVTVDSAGPEWLGPVGVVPGLIRRAELAPGTLAMLCGPEVMMRFSAGSLAASGVPAHSVHASMERNMQCGIAHCGHCQLGPTLVCRDGPVYRWSELERWTAVREL